MAAEGRAQEAMQGAVQAATPGGSGGAGGALPVGWTEAREPGSGQMYYVHLNTNPNPNPKP